MCISHQKILTYQNLSGPLGSSGLKSLHGFVIFGGRMVPIASKVVGSSSLENLSRKPNRKWPTVVNTFKKHQSAPTGTHKKSQILLTTFLHEYRGKEVPKKQII